MNGCASNGDAFGGLGFLIALVMRLVAGLAGHGWLIAESIANDMPGSMRVLGLDHLADGAVEVHAMAAEAVVHQAPLGVMRGVGKDLAVGGAVRTRIPGGVFLLVALFAVGNHLEHVHIAQAEGFRHVAEEMYTDVAQLGAHTRHMTIHTVLLAVRRGMHGAYIGGHLVAVCAALAVMHGVVIGSAIGCANSKQDHRRDGDGRKFQVILHDRNPVPFQLRTNAAEA